MAKMVPMIRDAIDACCRNIKMPLCELVSHRRRRRSLYGYVVAYPSDYCE